MPEPDPEPPTTVAIVTLGCGRNEVDSQNAAGMLTAAGYRVVADPEQADAVVVNTCAFVEAAKRESIETVLDATALKDQGRARGPGHRLPGRALHRGAAGRAPRGRRHRPVPDYGGSLRCWGGSPIPLAAGPLPILVPAGRRALPMVFPTPAGRRSRPGRPPPGRWPWSSWPRAATGTARSAPSRRSGAGSAPGAHRDPRRGDLAGRPGRLRGLPGGRELHQLRQGPWRPRGPVHLLRDLAGIDGLRRVRLNYLQPDELTPGLLEEMAANPVVCSYFDLSLQHASAPVLRRMRRGGSAGAFLDLVGRIRALDPDAAFRSNFILGFPASAGPTCASWRRS